MKHALLLLAIMPLACASNAVAAPAPAPPPAAKPAAPAPPPATPTPTPTKPATACPPSGTALFEIDHRVDPGAKLATSATKVFGNGAWTHDETDADGKALGTTTGCLAKNDVATLETTLKGAPWKVTTARMHCMAMSATFTVYQVNGKPVFTQRLCSGESLDEKSRAKLDAAVALIEGAAKP
jgi:hypothetical protein